jgi:YVTN family beta-propeller protein
MLAMPFPVLSAYIPSNAVQPSTTISGLNFPWAIAFDPTNNELYATNSGGSSVSVINATSNQIIKRISVGGVPEEIAYDSANNELYVANNKTNTVDVISGSSNALVANITGLRPGTAGPVGIIFDSQNKLVYVTDQGDWGVTVINGSNKVVAQVTLLPISARPWSLAVDPLKKVLYVADSASRNVYLINTKTLKYSTVTVGVDPWAVAYSSTNKEMYVSDFGPLINNKGNVTVLNATTNKVIKTISLGSNSFPYGVVFDKATKSIYVTNAGLDIVSVISVKTNKVVKTLSTGTEPWQATLDPVNHSLYVCDMSANEVSVISV